MKHNAGGWVKESPISEKKRKEIIDACWSRASDRKKAEGFWDDCQIFLNCWITRVDDEVISTESDRCKHVERIREASKELRAALDSSPGDVNRIIECEMDMRIRLPNEYPQHEEAINYLHKLGKKKFPDIYQMADMFDCLLVFLEDITAGVVALEKSPRRKNKGQKKWLIYNLAHIYERHFGKPPSSSNGSCFRKFIAKLYRALDYGILGAPIIAEVLKERIGNR